MTSTVMSFAQLANLEVNVLLKCKKILWVFTLTMA